MGWTDPEREVQAPFTSPVAGTCIFCGPVDTGMWAHFNSESHQSMVLLNLQAEIALPEDLRR